MLVIFDFDGTIADTLGTFVDIANKNLHRKMSPRKIRKMGITRLLKDLHIPRILLPIYITILRRKMSKLITKIDIFPGVREVLVNLRKKHELVILTSNSSSNVNKFLVKHNIENLFSEIDDSFHHLGKARKIKSLLGKRKMTSEECILVTDETRDIHSAQKMQVRSIAVTWGFESKSILKEAAPDYIVDRPVELLDILK